MEMQEERGSSLDVEPKSRFADVYDPRKTKVRRWV